MKRLFFILISFLLPFLAFAQEAPAPGWLKNAQKSIVSVIAYDKNKEMIHEGVGFIISEDGMVVSDYATFKDVYSAVVIDNKGKKFEVERIYGADDAYGLVKFSIDNHKTTPIKLASSTAVNRGAEVLAIGYFQNKPNVVPASTVEKKDIVESRFAYYTLSTEFDGKQVGKGAFNAAGELIGIIQSSVGGKSGVVDAALAQSLSMAAIQSRTAALALNNIHLKKALPDTAEESLVYLYFRSTTADDEEYLDLVDQFVTKFPDNAEGYYRRATPLIDLHRFEEADKCLDKYISLAADKSLAYSNVGKIIHSKLVYQPEPKYDKWTFDTAIDYMDKAIETLNPQIENETDDNNKLSLEVRQTECELEKAKILSSKGDHRAAIDIYEKVNEGKFRGPAIFMACSMAHAAAGDSLSVQVELMDSAVAQFKEPLPAEAAPYVLQRAQLLEAQGKYKKAVADYNTFLYLKNNKVSDQFYFDRSVLEMNGRMFQQAIDDINMAISMAPNKPDYYLHKSSIHLRVGQIDESIDAAEKCIQLAPDMSEAYCALGYALIQKGDKEGGRRNLEYAKSLGNENAQEIIDRYLK